MRNPFPPILLGLLVAYFIVMAIDPLDRFDWFLESLLVILFVPLFVWAHLRRPLSNLSYALLFVFMCLHITGSHWTYNQVPGPWVPSAEDAAAGGRNWYDRLVHFSFGLLLTIPLREFLLRRVPARGFWSYYLPVDVVLAFSAVYEVVEWVTALVVSPGAADAFLGQQGDSFDPVADIALAGMGSVVAMLGLAAAQNWRRPEAPTVAASSR